MQSRGRPMSAVHPSKRFKTAKPPASSSSSSDSDDDEPLVSAQSISSDSSSDSDDYSSHSDDSFETKVAKKRLTKDVQKDYKSGINAMRLFAETQGFERCVSNGRLITPMPVEFVAAYFEHLSNVMVPWRNHETLGKTKNYAPKSLLRVQSMIHDLYRQRFQQVAAPITSFFRNFNRWYVLKISLLMSCDPPEYPVDKISMPLSHEAWRLLLLRVWQARPQPGCTWSSITHLRTFLNMAKSMLGRWERVARMRWATLLWKKDALGGKIPTSKSDQLGDLSYLKLMFASVSEPESCVVLCLALDVCAKSRFDDAEKYDKIFPASFRSSLPIFFRSFINHMDDEDKAAMEVGTCFRHLPITLHTPKRTGSVILHSCEGVNWNSCRQRGDHKVDTEDSYLRFPSEVQDGIMGRVLAGFEFGSRDFEIQAPHLSPEMLATVPFKKLIPGYDKFPVSVQKLAPYFIASIVWHSEWLRKTVPGDAPMWSSVPLFTTQQPWLDRLSEKDENGNFVHIYGGRIGAKSSLPLSGRSFMSQDHAMLIEIRDSFQEFLKSWNARTSSAVIASQPHAPTASSVTTATGSNAMISKQLSQIHDLLVGNTAPAAGGGVQPCPPLPIAELPSTFQVPTGLRPEQLFNKWFCRFGQVPAWMHITKKQLKTQGRAQRDLFNKYEKVMEFIIGPAPIDQILKDVESSFEGCWARFCTAAEWPVTNRWSCSTVYDKLTPEVRAKLAAAPPMQWTPVQIQAHAIGAEAVPAFVRGIRAGQANADAAAADAISASLDSRLHAEAFIDSAIHGHHLPSAFRIPYGFTIEQFWTCWHTPCTISGFTDRWRDCNLLQLLRQLHRSDQRSFPASEFRAQSQFFSKTMAVMNALRACVTLSDADIDVDVSGTLESVIAAAKEKYGNIFYGAIRSVYNRLALARKE